MDSAAPSLQVDLRIAERILPGDPDRRRGPEVRRGVGGVAAEPGGDVPGRGSCDEPLAVAEPRDREVSASVGRYEEVAEERARSDALGKHARPADPEATD